MKFFIIGALLVVSAFAAPQYDSNSYDQNSNNYMFKYIVSQQPVGSNFGHQEMRLGNRVTGKYYVLLPDNRIQVVDYVADENGYRPTITYINP